MPSANLAIPPRPLRLIGGAALALAIAALVALALQAILAAGQGSSSTTPDIGYLLYISLLQAVLSTVLSLLVGIAIAWSLNRLRFPGRSLIIGLFASAIVTPGIIIAVGMIAVWGRAGWFGSLNLPIFGLGGVVAAHVILDASFAARVLLGRLDALPVQRLKTGQSLALGAWTRFAIIDWPAIKNALPGLAALIFLLAFTSFPIVLLLGGGPAVQTLEVAIYSAVRLDFDLVAAVHLALVQIAICTVVIIATATFTPVIASIGDIATQQWKDRGIAPLLQWLVLAIALLGFGAPLLSVLLNGVAGFGEMIVRPAFWSATMTSLLIAAASAMLALVLGGVIASARASAASTALRTVIGIPAYAYLAVPAVALALGAFLIVRNLGVRVDSAAPIVVILANALLALPFVVATLSPSFDAVARTRGRLIRSLGLSGLSQFRDVEWPLMARDIGLVLALSFCFSLGDLGVVALFNTTDFVTLPLLMVRALGSYRTNDAATIAALMLILTIAAFVAVPAIFERLSRARS